MPPSSNHMWPSDAVLLQWWAVYNKILLFTFAYDDYTKYAALIAYGKDRFVFFFGAWKLDLAITQRVLIKDYLISITQQSVLDTKDLDDRATSDNQRWLIGSDRNAVLVVQRLLIDLTKSDDLCLKTLSTRW